MLARNEVDRRLLELNALRREVTEDRGRFVEANAYQVWANLVEKRLTTIETRSAGSGVLWAIGASIVSAVVAAVLVIIVTKALSK